MVLVIGKKGKQLMPCHPARAREPLGKRRAVVRAKLIRARRKTVAVRTSGYSNVHPPPGVVQGGSCWHRRIVRKADGCGYHISQMELLPALMDGMSAQGGHDEKER